MLVNSQFVQCTNFNRFTYFEFPIQAAYTQTFYLMSCSHSTGMSKEDAMTAYISLAKEVIGKYGM